MSYDDLVSIQRQEYVTEKRMLGVGSAVASDTYTRRNFLNFSYVTAYVHVYVFGYRNNRI